jgi:hypothetical protein
VNPTAILTLRYSSDQRIDLALPVDVPVHTLSEAIAAGLGLPALKGCCYALLIRSGKNTQRIEPHQNLLEAGVMYGDFLELICDGENLDPPAISRGQAFLKTAGGQTFSLSGKASLIGRTAPNHCVELDLSPLDEHQFISRRHASIEEHSGRFFLIDEGSRNGTYLNGKRLPPKREFPLNSSDQILFGGKNGVEMIFFIQSES